MADHSKLNSLRETAAHQPWPEDAKAAYLSLLDLCEQLLGEQEALRAALAGKGKHGRPPRGGGSPPGGPTGGGRGGGKAAQPPAGEAPAVSRDHSSEAERRGLEPKQPWAKSGKRDQLELDREVLLREVPDLPADAVFERYEEVVVQDLLLVRQNTRFFRARYRSRSTGKSYLAPLPPGYTGQFGPGLRTLALSLAYGANVSQPLLHTFFRRAGCVISRGQVSRLVTTGLEPFVAEAQDAICAAVSATPWLQLDETRSGVRTEHGCCHVLGNALASYYRTTERGDRRSVIQALSLGRPLTYRLDDLALRYLEQSDVSQRVRRRLEELRTSAPAGEADFSRWLDLRFPALTTDHREQVLTAAALGGYYSQTEVPRVRALLTDDAAVLRGIIGEHALCWVHDARHYQQLTPTFAYQARQYRNFRRRYWKFYRRLLRYRQAPSPAQRARLERDFDRLVDETKAPTLLAECIARTRKNKAKLLLVLEHPELPLHNNAAELAVRRRVRKRDVSFGPVSAAGRAAWDTMQSLLGTVEKLGVSFWDYLRDRLHHLGAIPSLAELVQRKAALAGPTSWST